MDIYQIRRENLIRLIEHGFNGNQTAFAKAISIKAPQINRWLSETAGEKRRITESSARRIEKGCKKPPGWLDVADLVEVREAPGPLPDGLFQSIAQAWQASDDLEKAVVIAWAHAVPSKKRNM